MARGPLDRHRARQRIQITRRDSCWTPWCRQCPPSGGHGGWTKINGDEFLSPITSACCFAPLCLTSETLRVAVTSHRSLTSESGWIRAAFVFRSKQDCICVVIHMHIDFAEVLPEPCQQCRPASETQEAPCPRRPPTVVEIPQNRRLGVATHSDEAGLGATAAGFLLRELVSGLRGRSPFAQDLSGGDQRRQAFLSAV